MASSCKNHKALEQTYVAKQRRQLCSLSFQTLNPFPCRHPVLRVYHESYQEREREPAWDATLTEPVPRLTRMLASDWAQKVIIDKHSNELRNWFFLACERQTFLLAHATLRDGSRGGTPSTN